MDTVGIRQAKACPKAPGDALPSAQRFPRGMNLGGYAVVVRVRDPCTPGLAAEAVWHDTTRFLWQACRVAPDVDRTAGRGGRRRTIRGGQAASAGLQPGHVRRGRVRLEVRAVDYCAGPSRAPGAARAVDVPQAAGGGGAPAPGAAGAQGDRLLPVRAYRAGCRALPDRLRRATHEPQGRDPLDRWLFLLRRVRREGTSCAQPAAARMGPACV